MTAVTFQSLAVLLLSGIAVGAFIDGLRLIRDKVPFAYAKHWYVVELIGWLSCGVLTFYLLYNWQDGHWRWVNFFAQVVGIFLYDRYFFRIIRFVIRIIVYSIVTPIVFLWGIIWKIMLLTFYVVSNFINLLTFRRTR